MSRNKLFKVGLILGLIGMVPLVAAEEGLSIEARLLKLERQASNQILIEMLDRIDSLQAELQEMRALSEEQTHQVEALKQRQRDLYLDLDRRLSRTEREGGSALPISGQAQDMQGSTTSSLVGGGQPLVERQPLVAAGAESGREAMGSGEAESEALAEERAAYQNAFNLLRQLQYDPAAAAFKSFIKKYPSGRYAHIAQYWLGEASYARRDFKQAIVDYQLLIDHYPQSPKVAEAMLKMGYSRWELKAVIGAKSILDQLIAQYPNSPEAKQALPLLEKLNSRLQKK